MARRLIALMALTAVLAAGCGGRAPDADDARAAATTTVAIVTTTTAAPPIGDGAERVAPATEPSVELPSTALRQEAIVAAAVLIASGGDLEAAILDGVVTEAEAEAALLAIEHGTLGDVLTQD